MSPLRHPVFRRHESLPRVRRQAAPLPAGQELQEARDELGTRGSTDFRSEGVGEVVEGLHEG